MNKPTRRKLEGGSPRIVIFGRRSVMLVILSLALRASELKRRLDRFGISTAGCFEKQELLTLLRQRVPEALEPGHAVPLFTATAADGAMGAGVTVDTKVYYGLRLALSGVADQQAADRVLWVLDSAASHSLLTPSAATLLDASKTGVRATANTATSGTMGGFEQAELGWGCLSGDGPAAPLRPVIMPLPLPGEAGLLGLDWLARFDVDLRLRQARPCAVVYPAGELDDTLTESADDMTRLECRRLPSGLLVTDVVIDAEGEGAAPKETTPLGLPTRAAAVIDLGSPLTVCNWAAATAAGFRREGDPRVAATDQVIAGATGEPLVVHEAKATVQWVAADGRASRRSLLLHVADLPVFEAIGLGGAAMVAGLDCLAPSAAGEAGSRLVLAAGRDALWVEGKRSG